MKTLLLMVSLAGMGAAAGCSDSCVAAGSLVQTPGGLRRIETLEVGDAVYCVDVARGERVETTLTAVRSAVRECVSLQLGDTVLVCTSDHPLYDPDAAVWAPAGDWALGHRTRLLRVDGARVVTGVLVEAATFAGVHTVYDLTVAHPAHTFIAEGVVVHNKSIGYAGCTAADGGFVLSGEPCTCAGRGDGYTICRPRDNTLVCECPPSDAAVADAD